MFTNELFHLMDYSDCRYGVSSALTEHQHLRQRKEMVVQSGYSISKMMYNELNLKDTSTQRSIKPGAYHITSASSTLAQSTLASRTLVSSSLISSINIIYNKYWDFSQITLRFYRTERRHVFHVLFKTLNTENILFKFDISHASVIA